MVGVETTISPGCPRGTSLPCSSRNWILTLASRVPAATRGASLSRTPLCAMHEDSSVQPYAVTSQLSGSAATVKDLLWHKLTVGNRSRSFDAMAGYRILVWPNHISNMRKAYLQGCCRAGEILEIRVLILAHDGILRQHDRDWRNEPRQRCVFFMHKLVI